MSAHTCSFCRKFSSRVAMARICPSCAKGRTSDKWCDFCNKTAMTDFAWICPECAKGRVDDNRCDFCSGTAKGDFARICGRCDA